MAILTRIKQVVNAFRSHEEDFTRYDSSAGPITTTRPHTPRARYSSEKSIVTSIYTRIAIDVADIRLRHVEVDENDQYLDDVNSHLSRCFFLEANLDQGPRAFRQDICTTLLDEGVAAIVPVDTNVDPAKQDDFEIYTMRVGKITQWRPKHVTVSLYNENTGNREEITLEKRHVAIVENPLYAVMNEPNSTLQRLIRKLNLLDVVDEQSSSGKMDLIIQLPYVIKSEARRQQAEQRRKDIEFQLKGSQYGIAYTDGTERITQLNRPAENNLLKQIEFLTVMLYGQLGITEEVMNGTADEATMLNYHNRTVKPIMDAISEAMQRSLLGMTKYMKKQRIMYFRNPFQLVPLGQLADITDKFARNEVYSSNEIRGFMGVAPSKDPKANELRNSNMPQPPPVAPGPTFEDMDRLMNETFDGLADDLDKIGRSDE